MKIVVLGDIHFRDDKNYFRKTCEDFLKWYKNWNLNSRDNYLVLAGDLVETALLTGTVADYLERFSIYSNFKKVFICVGNHDIRKYNGENQLSYEFLSNKENFIVIKEITEINIEGKNALILPYFKGMNSKGLTMSEFYGSLYQNSLYSKHYDFIVGHFNEDSISFGGESDCVSNLDKLNVDKIILGHIHTRDIRPDIYIGSVFAGKRGENDLTRSALVFDGTIWEEERLPIFNEFLSVRYPEDLPKSNALNPIYTILSCNSESIARAKYGNIFIRKTTLDAVEAISKNNESLDRQLENIKNLNVTELFDMFVEAQKKPLDEDIISDCKSLLESKKTS